MRLVIRLNLLLLVLFILSGIGTAQTLLPPLRTGKFYVSSYSADSIAVYDSSGKYIHSFSAEGLDGPRGIVFAPNNKVYIASQLTDEIYIFEDYDYATISPNRTYFLKNWSKFDDKIKLSLFIPDEYGEVDHPKLIEKIKEVIKNDI